MEERKLNCSIITPIFSYGAYPGKTPEIRASELKGWMRYVYRMSCATSNRDLAGEEAELFGGAAGREGIESGHASPVRLWICGEQIETGPQKLLYHDKKDGNPPMSCLRTGHFDVAVRLNPSISARVQKKFPAANLEWYTNLVQLTLMLCGLGRRGRKGRGSIAVEGLPLNTKAEALQWICRALNQVAAVSPKPESAVTYRLEDGIISPCSRGNWGERPVIQKIYAGMKLTPGQVNAYLAAVDETCHQVKGTKYGDEKNATGGVGKGLRFASPLFIHLIRTQEGIYPLYVFVKAIIKEREIDADCKYREDFIAMVQKSVGRGAP